MSYFYAWNTNSNSLIFRPRLKVYRSGSLEFDPESETGVSYAWTFVRRINGNLVFNSARKSNTTTRHQWAMRSFLKEKGLKIDLVVDSGLSLTDSSVGRDALINEIQAALTSAPYPSRPNFEKARKIARVFRLKFSQELVDLIIVELEEKAAREFLTRSVDRQEKKMREFLRRLGAPAYHGPDPSESQETPPAPESPEALPPEVFPWAA